ncbi:MAG: hypothetical protein H7Y04_00530 [Verrucomicrobia bacterium]|nr:hypothetical protein [Cytophagales bacterium]
MQHKCGQTRNPITEAKRADKWGLSLVLLLFLLCIQKKSKKASLFQKLI